ncbi:FMRFamide receptor-like [Plakobranchus ocellatus]|uniref:FMRFamide receptor-like n=1 Tax=Plakobranchus ocellatus TaxID=259542 RepID=A0AAV4DRL5_9GAST|nr:FMRFamide receptor-like [Plakobranchus ocellatus]
MGDSSLSSFSHMQSSVQSSILPFISGGETSSGSPLSHYPIGTRVGEELVKSQKSPVSHLRTALFGGGDGGSAVTGGQLGLRADDEISGAGSSEGLQAGVMAAVKLLVNGSVSLLASTGVEAADSWDAGGGEQGGRVTARELGHAGESAGSGTVLATDLLHTQDAREYYYVNGSEDYFSTFYEQLLSHNTFKMRDELLKYVNPMLIILGNISNLIALIVLRRKKFKRSSVCFYLGAYAVANLLVLNLMLGLSWMFYIFETKHVTFIADWTCRLWMFLSNVITYSGIWFVVAMNVDRLIYISSRANAQAHCTRFSAKVVVTLIVILLVVVSIHAMWTYELRVHGCFVAFERNDLHTIIWPWWSAAVYSYIPLSTLIVLNVIQIAVPCVRHFRHGNSTGWGNMSSRIDTEGTDNFVLAALVISLHFFFLTVPATVINVLDIHLPSSWLQVDVIARIELAKKITEQMSSLNQSLLGLHLFACSPDFRRELAHCCRAIFRCKSARKRPFKAFELRGNSGIRVGVKTSNSDDSSSQHREVDYELCNSNESKDGEMTITSV